MTDSISAVGRDVGIPKPLREVIRQRRLLLLLLEDAISEGVTPKMFHLVDQLSDLNRSLQRRDWLVRVHGFDPIAMGM